MRAGLAPQQPLMAALSTNACAVTTTPYSSVIGWQWWQTNASCHLSCAKSLLVTMGMFIFARHTSTPRDCQYQLDDALAIYRI